MTSSSKIDCFGIQIDGIGWEELQPRLAETSTMPFWIITANPEILLYAREHKTYQETLQKADVRICDSFGIQMMSFLYGKKLRRFTGVELSDQLVMYAAEHNLRIAFVGGQGQVAHQAFIRKQKDHPTLKGYASQGGGVYIDGTGDEKHDHMIEELKQFDPHILLVAFGHPKQERWIKKHRSDFQNLTVIVGIGGTLDYWAGIIPRAPQWMQSFGLEWLYRLIQEPKRIARIMRAVIVFPMLFLFKRNSPA